MVFRLLSRGRPVIARYVAWLLAWCRYGVARVVFAFRSRGLRPRWAIAGVVAILGFGVVASGAVTGWPVPIGAAARLQQSLDRTQRQLAATEDQLRAANLVLAQMQAQRLSSVTAPASSKEPTDRLIETAELRTALQKAEKQRLAAHVLYQQALAALARSKKEQGTLAALNLRLERRVASLEAGHSAGGDRELASVEPSPALDMAANDQTDAPAPFDIRRFLAKLGVRPSGEGGPFVPVGSMRHGGADRQAMQILRSLPLTAPLAHYVVASPFGVRADPINEHEAFHTGVDLDAPYRSPVFNTAPGVVVFAGWAGAYGRMVEIDHGHGIHTRYCHLNRITVTVGERLRRRVRIGLLGSTGRSTGPHVHYEVRVNGIPEDPERFLQAGRSVVLVGDNR